MKNLNGFDTGLVDSNGIKILCGDLVRYEYKDGFCFLEDGTKIYCTPFEFIEDRYHETVMEYTVRKDCAGFFLDLPKGINHWFFIDTVKYFVVKNISYDES